MAPSVSSKLMYLAIAATAAIIVFLAILAPSGNIHVGDEKFGELQDTISGIGRFRERMESREVAGADPRLVDVYTSLFNDLTAAKSSDEHCIIPLRSELFRFTEINSIEIMESDDDLLIIMGFPTGEAGLSKHYETRTIQGMSLYVGEFQLQSDLPLSSITIEERVFPPINKRDASVVRLQNHLCPELNTNPIYPQNNYDYEKNGCPIIGTIPLLDRGYQPLFAGTSPSMELGYRIDYDSSVPLTGINPESVAEYNSLIIANRDEIIVMVAPLADAIGHSNSGSFDQITNAGFTNILNQFNENSAFGNSPEGLRLCNPEREELLKLRNGEPSCSIARNRMMCNSLRESNFGKNCVWEENRCIRDPNEVRPFFNSILGVFEEMVEDSYEIENTCWSYYDLEINDVPTVNLFELMFDLNLDLRAGSAETSPYMQLVHSSGLSSDLVYLVDIPLFSFANQPGINFRGLQYDGGVPTQNFRINEGSNNVVLLEQNTDGNDVYRFYVRHSQADDGTKQISLYPRGANNQNPSFIRSYNREADLVFCNPEIPYELGLLTENNMCDRNIIKNRASCFYHGLTRRPATSAGGNTLEGCYWNENEDNCYLLINADNRANFPNFPDNVQNVIDRIEADVNSDGCLTLYSPIEEYSFNIENGFVYVLHEEERRWWWLRNVLRSYPLFYIGGRCVDEGTE